MEDLFRIEVFRNGPYVLYCSFLGPENEMIASKVKAFEIFNGVYLLPVNGDEEISAPRSFFIEPAVFRDTRYTEKHVLFEIGI